MGKPSTPQALDPTDNLNAQQGSQRAATPIRPQVLHAKMQTLPLGRDGSKALRASSLVLIVECPMLGHNYPVMQATRGQSCKKSLFQRAVLSHGLVELRPEPQEVSSQRGFTFGPGFACTYENLAPDYAQALFE